MRSSRAERFGPSGPNSFAGRCVGRSHCLSRPLPRVSSNVGVQRRGGGNEGGRPKADGPSERRRVRCNDVLDDAVVAVCGSLPRRARPAPIAHGGPCTPEGRPFARRFGSARRNWCEALAPSGSAPRGPNNSQKLSRGPRQRSSAVPRRRLTLEFSRERSESAATTG